MILPRKTSGMGTKNSRNARANQEDLAAAEPEVKTNPAITRRTRERAQPLKRIPGAQVLQVSAKRATNDDATTNSAAGQILNAPLRCGSFRSVYSSQVEIKGISTMWEA